MNNKYKNEAEMFNSNRFNLIKAPESLTLKAKTILQYYRTLPQEQSIDLGNVVVFLKLFRDMLDYTDKLIDKYEYDRRLLSGGDINEIETTKELAERTIEWLKKQPSFDAGRAADIVHNFCFCLQLQQFSSGVKVVFTEADQLCDVVLLQYEIPLI